MKKILFALLALFAILPLTAEGKQIYYRSVYREDFYLYEYKDGNSFQLELFMADNKSKMVDTYDENYITVYSVWSKEFTNKSEYNNAVKLCKEFIDYYVNYVSLPDFKDSCDIEPTCMMTEYNLYKTDSGTEYIYLEYVCDDLEALFDLASLYNHRGRDAALKSRGGRKQ